MIIEIKNKEYQSPNWDVNSGIATFRLISDATFSEIVEDFVLESGDIIKQYNDNHEQTGEWFVEGMASISLPSNDNGTETIIRYHVGQMAKDTTAIINGDIEDVSDAALELAEMYAEFLGQHNNTLKKVEDDQREQGEQLKIMQTTLNQHTNSIGNWETMYNALADRVATLENKEA